MSNTAYNQPVFMNICQIYMVEYKMVIERFNGLEMHWTMAQLSLYNNDKSDDYGTVFYTEGHRRGHVKS